MEESLLSFHKDFTFAEIWANNLSISTLNHNQLFNFSVLNYKELQISEQIKLRETDEFLK